MVHESNLGHRHEKDARSLEELFNIQGNNWVDDLAKLGTTLLISSVCVIGAHGL